VLVVDDLVGWLIGRLADAGYKKLTTLVRGSEQERALKQAVTAAVQATAGEISPSDKEQADRLAERISGAFGKPTPVKLMPRQLTRLEGLYAGIAHQLSVLDDGGQPPAGLLGVPVSVVAARLTDHLIDEIKIRGSQGGPLTPLADQLNHDLTHLQAEEIKGMLAQLLGQGRDALAPPGSAAGRVGWPLAEVRDPFMLEVHRPVEPEVPQPGLPVLPAYVPREHDAALAEVVTAAAAGTSGIAVLVGGSSTGKTRACWQALELLRGLEPGWRLWHPIDQWAALAELPGIGPRSVVWLNEAQRYLDPADGTGERVAAALRELLRDVDRGPVLALPTLWPVFWDELTARPAGGADPHAQARELLAGHDIPVPAAFTPAQLRQLEEAGDPRLAQAAAGSRDGQVIQYLAGAPELLARYHHAPPAAQALIHASMDARRLGMRPALPRAFLEAAAPGYLTDTDWDLLGDNWLEEALDYTAAPCKGVRGPLTPIRPRPAPGAPASRDTGSAWQLADYLDQHGRRARQDQLGPPSLWDALTGRAASASDLTRLAQAAQGRGLYRYAAALWTTAVTLGSADAAGQLITHLHQISPGDTTRAAHWAVGQVSLDDPQDVGELLDALRGAGAGDAARALATRAAGQVSLDNPRHVAWLLRALREAGAGGAVTTLLARDPGAQASLDDPFGVAWLLDALRGAGADGAARALATRAGAHASLGDPLSVGTLLDALRGAGAGDAVTTLLARDPGAHASLDDGWAVGELLDALRGAGADGAARALATRAAAHASLGDPQGVGTLLRALREAGAGDAVTTLLARDPAAHASLGDPQAVAWLLRELREAGAGAGDAARALATRAAGHASLDRPLGVAFLLHALDEAGTGDAVTTLLARDPAAHADLGDPQGVGELLRTLREAGAGDAVTTLLARDPAAHASLGDPQAVAWLLRQLREAGADHAVTTLLARDPAARADLYNPHDVGELLEALYEAEAGDAATTLATRAVNAGMFGFFLGVDPDEASSYPFGREPDGTPSQFWKWQEPGSQNRGGRAD
jgi:uncharacterized protein YidB (DUF937 family)